VSAEVIDYQRIRAWLLHCESSRVKSCPVSPREHPTNFRLIDCLTRKLIRLANQVIKNQDYFTLSYVWAAAGGQRDHDAIDIRRLPVKGLPEVIEQAIEVVKRLEYCYLWVDRFCIKRDDPEDGKIQDRQMDVIYESSIAAVIVITDKNSKNILPGVGDTTT
jgi:hypothetical protein